MLKVEVVRRVDTEAGWVYKENPLLRRIIEWALDESLEDFVRGLLADTCREIGRNVSEAENFWVRVVHSDKPKLGYYFARSREDGKFGVLPDMLVGFANDILDFAESIVHEALHALNWSEEVTEARAKEIAFRVTVAGDN